MKYGETLRQRSIPAWSHHNIDYDEIKYFIKERTTPGKGKSVPVPGRSDEKLIEFENALCQILEDQHLRIGLFVRSKAGEIQRRLDHAKRQLKQLSARSATTSQRRIPISRLERYGKLEGDVLKAGDEIKSLARFTSTQRTAFRKLLKKYKKWTGSSNLEIRFREEALDDPKSFTNIHLGHLLDDYSQTLLDIRNLFESRAQQPATTGSPSNSASSSDSSPLEKLQNAVKDRSKVEFDTVIATVPLGSNGEIANYFCHFDNVVELQVLLLHHLEFYAQRSRSSSAAVPTSPALRIGEPPTDSTQDADYFMLVADNLRRFAHEQSAVTINDRELLPGVAPQKAKAFFRWNNDDEAVLSVRSSSSKIRSVSLKKKYVDTFFDANEKLSSKSEVRFENGVQNLAAIRSEILKDPTIKPLYQISSCRSRFISINNDMKCLTLATLDTKITMQNASPEAQDHSRSDFPFAVLQVRQEGQTADTLISILDHSHLVERVRGFSLQYHALWEICKPSKISQPFWMPILSRDIRKLPPPALDSRGGSSNGSRSATRQSMSTNSILGFTDSATAVETGGNSSSPVLDQLRKPVSKSFRKKRRRTYAEEPTVSQSRYWSEYDHPEDASETGDAYILYIDPNEKSTLDRLFERIGSLFIRRPEEEEGPLMSPGTPHEGETSSDEDEALDPREASYGTMARRSVSKRRRSLHHYSRLDHDFLPHATTICMVASIVILIVAYLLAATSRHRYVAAVDAGIVFAIICSLIFAIIGFISLLRRDTGSWFSFGVATGILILDAICSGGLLAKMLG